MKSITGVLIAVLLLLMLCGSGYRYRCIDRPFNEYAWGERPAMSENGLALQYVSPADGAVEQALTGSFAWSVTGAEGTVSYDVYFGDSNPPDLVVTDTTETSYSYTVADYYTTYYWRVVAVDDDDSIVGAVQSFTTLWDPSVIPNMWTWLDDASPIFVDTAGTTVAGVDSTANRWEDRSGNNRHARGNAANRAPLVVDSVFASKPAVRGMRFDGITNGLLIDGNITGDLTVCVVAKTTTEGSGDRTVVEQYQAGYLMGFSLKKNIKIPNGWNLAQVAESDRRVSSAVELADNTVWQSFFSTGGSDSMRIWINNEAKGNPKSPKDVTGNPTNNFISVGYRPGSSPLDNGITVSLMLFNRILTADERNKLYTWLSARYGL